MLFSVFLLLTEVLGCLSKLKQPSKTEPARILVSPETKRGLINVKKQLKTIEESKKYIDELRSTFPCMGITTLDTATIYFENSVSAVKRQEILNFWFAVNFSQSYENNLKFFQVKDETMGTHIDLINRADLVLRTVASQSLLMVNYELSQVKNGDFAGYVCLLKSYALRYQIGKTDSSSSQMMVNFYKMMSNHITNIMTAIDPDFTLFDQVDIDLDALLPYERIYEELMTKGPVTGAMFQKAFSAPEFRNDFYIQENKKIVDEYVRRLKEIKRRLDDEFTPEKDEKFANEEEILKFHKHEELAQNEEQFQVADIINESEDSSEIESEAPDDQIVPMKALAQDLDSATLPKKKLEGSKNPEKKPTKAVKKREKSRLKHIERLAKLELEATNQIEVDSHFYYTTLNQDANQTYERNQMMQMQNKCFPATKRYQHSIYPNITASGTTINFLIKLVVTGTPDWEGFIKAHLDLGGTVFPKKNGTVRFSFPAPIVYQKTLHPPHASSRFDRVISKRFYLAVAMNPLFFILAPIEKK